VQGTTHVAIGFLSGAVVAAGFHVPLYLQTGAVLMVASIGSLMPDIDTPASKMSKSLGGLRKPIGLFAHRGLTHSLVALIIVAVIMAFLQVQFVHAVAFLVGYASHLAADSVTKQGIRLWWPSQRRFRLVGKRLTIKTGGAIDWLIGIASLVLAIVVLIQFR
jgi:inner membrane protein